MSTAPDPDTTVDTLLAEVEPRLRRLTEEWHRYGHDIEGLGDAAAIADRMVAALPSPSPWNSLVGPFYRTSQVARMLGVTRQAVDERRTRGTLLGCRTRDGHWVFPTFQFAGRRTRPELIELLSGFDQSSVDGWTLAAWLMSPQRPLDDTSPLDHLDRLGWMDDRLAALAVDQQARWSA